MTDQREPLVMVLGIQEEWAAVEVGKELDARGVRWISLNVADFPLTMTLGAELTPDAGSWHGSVRSAEHELPLAEVTAVLDVLDTPLGNRASALAAELDAELSAGGVVLNPAWRQAFAATPRHRFRPADPQRRHGAGAR